MQFEYMVAYGHGKKIQKVMKAGEVIKNGSIELSILLDDAGKDGYEYMGSIDVGKIEVGERQYMLVLMREVASS